MKEINLRREVKEELYRMLHNIHHGLDNIIAQEKIKLRTTLNLRSQLEFLSTSNEEDSKAIELTNIYCETLLTCSEKLISTLEKRR